MLLALLMLAPAALASSPQAGARGKYRGQCRQLTKQIEHYQGTILPLARARGNRAWEAATNDQVERLWHRRADLCPAYGAERKMLARAADQIRRFNQILAAAGRAAVTYFTGGMSGF
jgi:hypothetical protein